MTRHREIVELSFPNLSFVLDTKGKNIRGIDKRNYSKLTKFKNASIIGKLNLTGLCDSKLSDINSIFVLMPRPKSTHVLSC